MIIITAGLARSGLSRSFEMTRALLELSGHPQPIISEESRELGRRVNVVRRWSDERLGELIHASKGTKIVVKTNAPPDEVSIGTILRHLDADQVRIHVLLRDPRDIVASMLEEPKASSAADRGVEELSAEVAQRLRRRFRPWCLLPSLRLRYDDVASREGSGPQLISRDLGLEHVDAEELWRVIERRTPRLQPFAGSRDQPLASLAAFFSFYERGDREWLDGDR